MDCVGTEALEVGEVKEEVAAQGMAIGSLRCSEADDHDQFVGATRKG